MAWSDVIHLQEEGFEGIDDETFPEGDAQLSGELGDSLAKHDLELLRQTCVLLCHAWMMW